jgi:transposase
MTFTGVARLVNLSLHRVMALYSHYVEQAVAEADFSEVRSLAIDETSRARGQRLGDEGDRAPLGIRRQGHLVMAEDLKAHGADPHAIESVSIDMSPAFIKGG